MRNEEQMFYIYQIVFTNSPKIMVLLKIVQMLMTDDDNINKLYSLH